MWRILLLLPSLYLSGCAATSYQPSGWKGGYSDVQLGEDVFKVRFKGNGYTGKSRASDFALLRCAELTLAGGYRYFIIIDENNTITRNQIKTPTYTTGSATATSTGGSTTASGTSTSYGGQIVSIAKPSSENLIKCFKEKPTNVSVVYDAKFLQKSLKESYGLP